MGTGNTQVEDHVTYCWAVVPGLLQLFPWAWNLLQGPPRASIPQGILQLFLRRPCQPPTGTLSALLLCEMVSHLVVTPTPSALLTFLLSSEVAGRLLITEARTHLLVFGMEQRLPPNSELVQAVLRLFQEPVPKAALRRHERLPPHSAQARVTVEWLRIRDDGSNHTSLIDSRWGQGGAGV